MKTFTRETQGSIYAIFSGLLYGLVGYFGIRLLETDASISNMQFWRFLVSAGFTLLIMLAVKKFRMENPLAMFKAFLTGAVFYSLSTGLYFLACNYIGSGLSMVIFFTYPAMVIVVNYVLYRLKAPKAYYFAISLILLGMCLLVDLGSLKGDLSGLMLAVGSGLLYALYIVSSKNVQLSPLLSTCMVSMGSAFAFLIVAGFNGDFSVPTTSFQWMHVFGFGIVSTAIPILLLLEGLKRISAEKASILSVLEPVFVVIFGVLLLEEVLNFSKIVGVLIVLCGALLTLISHRLGRFRLSSFRASA